MLTVILIVAALMVGGWGLQEMHKKGTANFWRLLADTNERQGTNFGTSQNDQATLIGGDMYKGGVLAFDQKNRKIAYLTKGGKSIEILDYGFVRSWRVTWRDNTRVGGAKFGVMAVGSSHSTQDHVFLEITTNDIERPIIKLPMSSRGWAQETSARLEIMINTKK